MLVHLEHAFKKGDKVRMMYTPHSFGFIPEPGIPAGAIEGYANEFTKALWEHLPYDVTLVVQKCRSSGVFFENWPYAWPSGMFVLEEAQSTKISGFIVCTTSPHFKLIADNLEIHSSAQSAKDALEDMIELQQISREPPMSGTYALAFLGFPEVFSINLESVKV